ncbi:hypothetical protein MIMGU_mgv1a017467mg [Erythranthe guttata]|uniref:Uncharacterized protein n=1 Tax=Erythranthe guttata TaxID=4155 RepID=A0A022R7F1_ERYGU|nr:hypothetical protein MIMGU_mgv1a017467mg [Erythranthe guttata]
MKASLTLVASVVAASTAAVTSFSSISGDRDISINSCTYQGKSVNSPPISSEKGKFAPKYDGLKFIETLITAHR